MVHLPDQVGSSAVSWLARTNRSDTACQLFVHCVASLPGFEQLARHVHGVDKYAERALLLARHEDVVCLAHPVCPLYLDFLQQLQLGPARQNIVWLPAESNVGGSMVARLRDHLSPDIVPPALKNSPEVWLNCFAASRFDPTLQGQLSELLGRPVSLVNRHADTLNQLYDKQFVRQRIAAWGLPLPPGECVTVDRSASTIPEQTHRVRQAIRQYSHLTGQVIVRGALGASGSSVFLLSDEERDITQALTEIAQQGHTDVFLVEPFLNVSVSPNVGMYIDPRDGSISCVAITDQILDGQIRHMGNRYPSNAQLADQMVAAATHACTHLRAEGTTGFLGFDFCEYQDPVDGEVKFFFAELNPRFNGANYPAHVIARLNEREENPAGRYRAFRAVTMQTTLKSFRDFEALHRDLLLDGGKPAGILPYNVGLLEHGKLMLAIVGETSCAVESVFEQFCRRSTESQCHDQRASDQPIAA